MQNTVLDGLTIENLDKNNYLKKNKPKRLLKGTLKT